MTASVRPYCAEEREALLSIGAETAFFGEPIEAYMEDRRIFMDALYSYYTDDEPEHAWVAWDGRKVVGFLAGCTDTSRHERISRERILPWVIKKWLSGEYHPGWKTYRYAASVLRSALLLEMPPSDTQAYPAHLHINLLPEARGQGYGKMLISAYLGQLRALNIHGVHLHTTSQNVAACHLYEKFGFRLLEARRTRMFAHLISSPVDNRCYGLLLRESGNSLERD